MRLHSLPRSAQSIEPPKRFTYPFCYEPHPLCLAAVGELKGYLSTMPRWSDELSRGKMLGVLVVEVAGRRGFLAAFSGTLAGQLQHDYFVPPVFDLMAPGCYFQQEQERISSINRQVQALQAEAHPSPLHQQAEQEIAAARQRMRMAKQRRDEQRALLSADEMGRFEPEFIRESQFLKAESKRIEHFWRERLAEADKPFLALQERIRSLQTERRQRSSQLQDWLFSQYVFLNARGEGKSLHKVFTGTQIPSGAGDCCAPKLLQYAYQCGMRPLCMAEFWVGQSPVDEVRLHGHFYPACRSKCKPILGHMLQGLDVEPNPLLQDYQQLVNKVRVVWHDAHLAVLYKPSGLLSVPGLDDLPSIQSLVPQFFPQAQGPIIVHRLDMDTSGLMVVALTPQAYQGLQEQFVQHRVQKQYVALLERPMPVGKQGDIDLPLRPDLQDRPRQLVDPQHGRPAQTHYQVLDNSSGHALVALWPHTGRTHQLRVHCAHPQGLSNPIVGDRLYGQPSTRLMLHAAELRLQHPLTGETLHFALPAEFS